jgi:hypothetical protein
MGAQDNLGALVKKLLYGRDGSVNTVIVLDNAFL